MMKTNFKQESKRVMKAFALAIACVSLAACASKKAAKDVAQGEGAGEGGGAGLGTLERIYFDFNKAGITDAASQTLKSNAEVLRKNPSMKILVEGHCDERGTAEYNIALGEKRAKAGLDHLVNLGTARSRLQMKSWGMEKPLDSSHNETAWAKNRRDEFVILSK